MVFGSVKHRLKAQVPFPDILLWCCFCFRNSCCFSSNKIGKATSQRSGIVTHGKLPYAKPNGFTRQVANDPQQSENSSEGQEENSDNLNPDSSAKVVAPVSASCSGVWGGRNQPSPASKTLKTKNWQRFASFSV